MHPTLRLLPLLLLVGLLAPPAFAHHGGGRDHNDPPATRSSAAQRVDSQLDIKIDGQLSEAIWQGAPTATDFIQNGPNPGAAPSQPTEVWIAYDDNALYLAAYLHDTQPDSIFRELSTRDNVGNADWFALVLDPFQTGTSGFGFLVNPDNVQTELKYNPDRTWSSVFAGDRNWDGVWVSATQITERGWTVELKIPYATLRFPSHAEQTWNANFARHIRRNRETNYWSEVDPSVEGLLTQSGKLTGIRDIRPPLRLQAMPFVTAGVTNYFDKNARPRSEWANRIGGGMDVKYGINDAFTLDMTLIPDFSEARSDARILNLSAFEQRFDENRQFFQEGTELFNKGGLFYSRRIGARPLHYGRASSAATDTEIVVENPAQTQLLNATKVSGRTNGGLGIGVFNAVANRSQALLRDEETGTERTVETNPLTNYNVAVLDQALPNNGFVTLINTNVLRNGADYDANVTGTVFDLRDKKNQWSVNGQATSSQQYFTDTDDVFGYSYNVGVDRISGVWQYGVNYLVEDDRYDINDLGFLFNNNSRVLRGNVEWNQFEPRGAFNRGNVAFSAGYQRLFAPDVFTDFSFGLNTRWTTRRFFTFGARTRFVPVENYDYFDARTPGRAINIPTSAYGQVWFSSDYSKRYALDGNIGTRAFSDDQRSNFEWRLQQRFRVNNRMNLRLRVEFDQLNGDVGYIGHTAASADLFDLEDAGTPFSILPETGRGYGDLPTDAVVLSRRNQRIFDNRLAMNYTFTNVLSLELNARHYWTQLTYAGFLNLMEDGSFVDSEYRGEDADGEALHDTSFNLFNLDMVARWRFAPGSDALLVWKNNIFRRGDDVDDPYLTNLGNLLDAPQTNSVSVKVVYWLDYATLRS